ncbi:MAG: hypothetical protein WA432_04050 [Candidatus Babeliaceae bacterium]
MKNTILSICFLMTSALCAMESNYAALIESLGGVAHEGYIIPGHKGYIQELQGKFKDQDEDKIIIIFRAEKTKNIMREQELLVLQTQPDNKDTFCVDILGTRSGQLYNLSVLEVKETKSSKTIVTNEGKVVLPKSSRSITGPNFNGKIIEIIYKNEQREQPSHGEQPLYKTTLERIKELDKLIHSAYIE